MRTQELRLDGVKRVKTETSLGREDGRFDVDSINGIYPVKHPSILELKDEDIPTPAFVCGAQELVRAGVVVSPIYTENGVTELTAYPMRQVNIPEDSIVGIAVEIPNMETFREDFQDEISQLHGRIDELEE